MPKQRKAVPRFVAEADESRYLETHDSAGPVDWSKVKRARFPFLEPTTTAILLRLPVGLLDQIKTAANKRDLPYQWLIKAWLSEKVGR